MAKKSIQFKTTSLDKIPAKKLDLLIGKVLNSKKGASAIKSMMRSVMRSALKSAIKSVGKSPIKNSAKNSGRK